MRRSTGPLGRPLRSRTRSHKHTQMPPALPEDCSRVLLCIVLCKCPGLSERRWGCLGPSLSGGSAIQVLPQPDIPAGGTPLPGLTPREGGIRWYFSCLGGGAGVSLDAGAPSGGCMPDRAAACVCDPLARAPKQWFPPPPLVSLCQRSPGRAPPLPPCILPARGKDCLLGSGHNLVPFCFQLTLTIVRQTGGLGISIAGGKGSTPYKGDDEVTVRGRGRQYAGGEGGPVSGLGDWAWEEGRCRVLSPWLLPALFPGHLYLSCVRGRAGCAGGGASGRQAPGGEMLWLQGREEALRVLLFPPGREGGPPLSSRLTCGPGPHGSCRPGLAGKVCRAHLWARWVAFARFRAAARQGQPARLKGGAAF